MAQTNLHGRIIAAAARSSLKPLGFQRKGASRIWFADKGFWLLVVEFQPSAWSRGSYLNVAAHWLWKSSSDALRVHLSFDYGGRVGRFISFENESQFSEEAESLAQAAVAESSRLSELLVSIEAIADRLLVDERRANDGGRGGHWGAFHAGVAAGLADKMDAARAMFDAILATPRPAGSVLHPMAQMMLGVVGDHDAFRQHVLQAVNQRREKLKLPALDGGIPT